MVSKSELIDEPAFERRLVLKNLMAQATNDSLVGQEVIDGLKASPKSLPPKYFYDEKGSQLFEQICELPEYYPTRTETAILKAASGAIAQQTGPCEIVELGSGSSTKTRLLLDAYQLAKLPLRYLPVDVSDTMLSETAKKLLNEYSQLSVYALASTYEPALTALPTKQLPVRMVVFLGSTIGNLNPKECDQFLSLVSSYLEIGDYFLLGLDLQKETSILEAAYNDSQGVTAAFNLNMLSHLNHRFEGDFKVSKFSHIAHYNRIENQIEMYLESLAAQTVRLEKLGLAVEFEKGDRILSEISRKFNLNKMTQSLSLHHLNVIKTFTDKNQWFGVLLTQRS